MDSKFFNINFQASGLSLQSIQITSNLKYLVHCQTRSYTLESNPLEAFSLLQTGAQTYQFRMNNTHLNAELIDVNLREGLVTLKIGRKKKIFKIESQLDQLISDLGFNSKKSVHDDALMAPMPGLVLDVKVSVGQSVVKGDHLITLEAMKMENILRSQHDGIVQEIHTSKGDKVEKNQLLIIFEQHQDGK